MATLRFFDEYGEQIPVDYLKEILEISSSEEDFINKVTLGTTDEKSELDPSTVENLRIWYAMKEKDTDPIVVSIRDAKRARYIIDDMNVDYFMPASNVFVIPDFDEWDSVVVEFENQEIELDS